MMNLKSKILLGFLMGSLVLATSLAHARTIKISKSYTDTPNEVPYALQEGEAANDVWHSDTFLCLDFPNLLYNVPGDSPGDVIEVIIEDSAVYNIKEMVNKAVESETGVTTSAVYDKVIQLNLGNSGATYSYKNIWIHPAAGQTPTIDYAGQPLYKWGGRHAFVVYHNQAGRKLIFDGIKFINQDLNEDFDPISSAVRYAGGGMIIFKNCVFETVSPAMVLSTWAPNHPICVDDEAEFQHCAFSYLKGKFYGHAIYFNPQAGDTITGTYNIEDCTFALQTPIDGLTPDVFLEETNTLTNLKYVFKNNIFYNLAAVGNKYTGVETDPPFDAAKILDSSNNCIYPSMANYGSTGTGNLLNTDPKLATYFPTFTLNAASPCIKTGSNGQNIGFDKVTGSGSVTPTPNAARHFTLYQ